MPCVLHFYKDGDETDSYADVDSENYRFFSEILQVHEIGVNRSESLSPRLCTTELLSISVDLMFASVFFCVCVGVCVCVCMCVCVCVCVCDTLFMGMATGVMYMML